jgi:hypothetical protein
MGYDDNIDRMAIALTQNSSRPSPQPTSRTWPVARGDVYQPRLTRGIVAPVLVGHASPCANVLAGCALRG